MTWNIAIRFDVSLIPNLLFMTDKMLSVTQIVNCQRFSNHTCTCNDKMEFYLIFVFFFYFDFERAYIFVLFFLNFIFTLLLIFSFCIIYLNKYRCSYVKYFLLFLACDLSRFFSL
jgi:hypothetical protein